MARNVLGSELAVCSKNPVTGFFRDGCCNTNGDDGGMHTICVVMTEEFLTFSKERGNDLSTPRPEYGFPGLKAGNQWCVCLIRWKEALDAGVAPPVRLEATHVSVVEFIDLETLREYSAGEES
ncbi:DUF2237 domain-containing protein [bacterium]|nr:DUF2237 domain-containing protein [bacterium]MDB4508052.1 DUF2237 domain-containing protein [Akkermansiaceae bacterium]